MSEPNSPQYGPHSKVSYTESFKQRKEERQSGPSIDQLRQEIDVLKRNQDNDQKKIADLEEFRRGMNGDENIRVDDNKITWVGRGGDTNMQVTQFDVAVNGAPKVTNMPYDGFRNA